MTTTRREFLAATTGALALLAGCTGSDDETTIAELEVELRNRTSDQLMFHFVFETDDGLGEWMSAEVTGNGRETVTVEPPGNEELLAIHGLVDDQPVRSDLPNLASGTVCLRVRFDAEPGEEPQLLYNTDADC